MKIITREEVIKDLIALPCELSHDFYVKEIVGKDTLYHPIAENEIKNFI